MDIDVGNQLTEEQIKKIKEAALKRADEAREEVNDMGDKATAEEAKEAVPVQRTVFLDKKVDLLVYDGDQVVNTLHPDRNILEICLVLKSIDKDTIVSIYGKEGPGSDPLPEGQDEPLYPIFDIVKKPVAEAMKLLVTNMVAEDVCLTEYQRLCDFMSFRSSLKACMITMIFKGGQPGGFSYLSSCTDVSNDDLVKLYDVAKMQIGQYKAKVKEVHPEVKFDDDSNIITHI